MFSDINHTSLSNWYPEKTEFKCVYSLRVLFVNVYRAMIAVTAIEEKDCEEVTVSFNCYFYHYYDNINQYRDKVLSVYRPALIHKLWKPLIWEFWVVVKSKSIAFSSMSSTDILIEGIFSLIFLLCVAFYSCSECWWGRLDVQGLLYHRPECAVTLMCTVHYIFSTF